MILGGALLVALLAQSATGAAPGATPARARLEVRGPADCSSRSDLAVRVAARSRRIQFADDAAIDAQVAFTSAHAGSVVAELVLGAPGAAPSPRRVVARSCAEAADAVALIIAVTLDPNANGRAAPASEPPAASIAPQPTAKPPEPAAAPKPTAPPETVEAHAAPRAPSAAPTRRELAAYVAGQTVFGPAPAVMPGIAIYLMVGLNRDRVWAPALLVGVTHVGRSNIFETDGDVSFALDAASLDACPVRLGSPRVAVRPCASALIGRLAVSGSATVNAASVARPFATAGADLLAGLGVSARIEISLRIGVGVTLVRDSYQLAMTTFHRADRITSAASVGIGARW